MLRERLLSRSLRVGLLLALPLSITPALAQKTGFVGGLFAPGDHVPLSGYVDKQLTTSTVTMHVDVEILAWIQAQSGSVQVARKALGPVQYLAPTSVDYGTGIVTLSGPGVGTCVVVTSLLTQDLDIVSHWDAGLNGGRGGQSIGAADGISTLDFDPVTGQPFSSGGNIRSSNPSWVHPVSGDRYYWASDVYALFSDGTGVHDGEAVPAFERYIAESYSTNAVTPLRVIHFSDQVRAATGFPVAHRSHPRAFDPASLPGEKVANGLPLFQVVHCHLVDTGDLYASVPGSENSLGTFLLPPGWHSEFEGTYPILFNGFYDIHASTFGGVGLSFADTIAKVYRNGQRRAVGVMWNGGGAAATGTFHRSAYDNANQLIQDAATLLRADPERIVATGGSRGGTTALEVASNPYDLPYTVKFVNAWSPQLRIGESIALFGNPTYPLAHGSIRHATGYTDSFRAAWVDPDTGLTGRQLTAVNFFDTTDTSFIDANYAIHSELFRSRLGAEDTRVVLRTGTHDYSRLALHSGEYYDALVNQADPVPIQYEIFYRFGHTAPEGTLPTDEDLLNKVFGDDDTLDVGVEHYKTDPANYTAFLPLDDPDHIPLVYETPLAVGTSQYHSISLVGEPGGRVQIWVAKLPSGWQSGDPPPSPASFLLFRDVVLSQAPGATFGTFAQVLNLPIAPSTWWYEARYSPDGDATFETILGQGDIAAPTLVPNFEPILVFLPVEIVGVSDETRTGGLAGDCEF